MSGRQMEFSTGNAAVIAPCGLGAIGTPESRLIAPQSRLNRAYSRPGPNFELFALSRPSPIGGARGAISDGCEMTILNHYITTKESQ